MVAIESAPNIGRVLGSRLRAVGIDSVEALHAAGELAAFHRLIETYPEEACAHTRRALAGAVRNVRHWALPDDIVAAISRDYPSSR